VDAGWSTRLRDVFGAALEDIENAHIKALVDGGVTEAADLDFKATLYGTTDDKKRELCKDIAAMRNDRGGVIVLGVADKNAIAVGCPEVQLTDAEERRMLQIVASGTAPHAAFDVRRVPGSTADKGFYLLVVQPSPYRPHAVLVDEGLRYPRRDGSTTRWLSEIEVADLYRDRFRGEGQQIERLSTIADEAKQAINEAGRPWLMASLVPNTPSSIPVDSAGRKAIEAWARQQAFADGFEAELFPGVAAAQVGVRRYTLCSVHETNKPPEFIYAECHSDGSGVAALAFRQHTENQPQVIGVPPRDGTDIIGHALIRAAAGLLSVIGRHASRTGVTGDAAVELRLFGPEMHLASAGHGFVERRTDLRAIPWEQRSRHTAPISSLAGTTQELIAATYLMLTDIYHAFGVPEIPQITAEGALRRRYYGAEMLRWAEDHGVPVVDEQVPD
jgi:hypothetical protein